MTESTESTPGRKYAEDVAGFVVFIFIVGLIYVLANEKTLTTEQKWGLGVGSFFVGFIVFGAALKAADALLQVIVGVVVGLLCCANVGVMLYLGQQVFIAHELDPAGGLVLVGAMFAADLVLGVLFMPMLKMTGFNL